MLCVGIKNQEIDMKENWPETLATALLTAARKYKFGSAGAIFGYIRDAGLLDHPKCESSCREAMVLAAGRQSNEILDTILSAAREKNVLQNTEWQKKLQEALCEAVIDSTSSMAEKTIIHYIR